MGRKEKKALSIMEVVAIIVVFAVAIPPLLISLSDVTDKVAQAELTSSAVIFGRSLLEEILSKNFDENSKKPWSSTLGPEGGETRNTYDDVDDFDGFSESGVSGFPGMSRSVNVYYVDPDNSNLDTPVTDPTDYKRVDVTVSHEILGDLNFSLVVSSAY